MIWYYLESGNQVGPVGDAEVEALAQNGRINSSTLVWREGLADWQPYAYVMAQQAAPGIPPIAAPTGMVACTQCGRSYQPEDLLEYEDHRVCANCKPYFFQRLKEGLPILANFAIRARVRYAGFWIRFVAAFLDGLLLWAVLMVVGVAVGFFSIATRSPSSRGFGALFVAQILINLIGAVIAIAYYTFFVGKYGATLGKMALGLRIRISDGRTTGYGRSLCRYFAQQICMAIILFSLVFQSEFVTGICGLLGFAFFLFAYCMAGFDSEKRALHDRICNTRVVYK
jgi:uncharacterized RDD family membrane protein YckC